MLALRSDNLGSNPDSISYSPSLKSYCLIHLCVLCKHVIHNYCAKVNGSDKGSYKMEKGMPRFSLFLVNLCNQVRN
jgi:hypothetical protein